MVAPGRRRKAAAPSEGGGAAAAAASASAKAASPAALLVSDSRLCSDEFCDDVVPVLYVPVLRFASPEASTDVERADAAMGAAAAAGARWLRPRRCCWMAPSVGLRPVPGEKWPAGHGGADAVSEAPAGAGAGMPRTAGSAHCTAGARWVARTAGDLPPPEPLLEPPLLPEPASIGEKRGERRRCLSGWAEPRSSANGAASTCAEATAGGGCRGSRRADDP